MTVFPLQRLALKTSPSRPLRLSHFALFLQTLCDSMPPPPEDSKRHPDKPTQPPSDSDHPPQAPPPQPQNDGSAGKLLWLAAGAALMWLGGTLHDALNTDDAPRQRKQDYKERKRASSAWPNPGASTSCAQEALVPNPPHSARSNKLAAASSADERIIPSFLCPITHEIMQDPVSTPYGHSYERAAILKYAVVIV